MANYTVGGKAYKCAKYGSEVVDIQKIVGETKKYFKLEDGTLISKDSGTVRGTAGNGSFRDCLDTVHYYAIDDSNAKDIELRYKSYKVKELKSLVASIGIRDVQFTEAQVNELEVHLTAVLSIIRKGKKVKEG